MISARVPPNFVKLEQPHATLHSNHNIKMSSTNDTTNQTAGENATVASFNGLLDQFKLEVSTRVTRSTTRKTSIATSPSKTITKVTKRSKLTKSKANRRERENSAEAYRDLQGIPDNLGPNLILVFCGANPGLLSGTIGHA